MFDLSVITSTDSADIPLVHPVTRAPLGATVTLAGPDHPTRRKLVFNIQRKLRATFARKGKFEATDPEEDEAEATERLAQLTLGWSGIKRDGIELPFSIDAARALYTDAKLSWLRTQLLVALDDHENFIKGSESA